MIDLLLLAGIVVLIILFSEQKKRLDALQTRLGELETGKLAPAERKETRSASKAMSTETGSPDTGSETTPAPIKRAAKAAAPPGKVTQRAEKDKPAPTPPKPKTTAPAPSLGKRFEDLIGGKLPIWIGGIALVFAGFFLVRFSIEAGYFGPTTRCITAALFGLLLIGLAEFGNRIPRFGSIFTDDLRIGHSIAGAGIAVLYATLYMASELYGLLGLSPALIGVIAVTILAFVLSQKHGPPTAIMGLLGGFAAPYVAGLGPESVAPLLIYLGVFTAGLFGLAIHRGWAWLALLATGGSIIWTTALLFMDVTSSIPFLGSFIVILAIGGVLTISRMDNTYGIPKATFQALPLIAGLIQLSMLAPLIEFSVMGWLFFAVLCVFAIVLAWRDEEMTPAVAGALGLAFLMVFIDLAGSTSNDIAAAVLDPATETKNPYPAIGFAILFGLAGHIFALREKSGWMWAIIGLAAPSGMFIIAALVGAFDSSETVWGAVSLAVAVSTGVMAWRLKGSQTIIPMPMASGLTAFFAAVALWLWTPSEVGAIIAVTVTAGLAAWARFTGRRAIAVETTIAAVVAGLLMLIPGSSIVEAMMVSLGGETDLYHYLPNVGEMVLKILIPALGIIALAFVFRETLGKRFAAIIASIGLVAGAAFNYLLYKQPLAIGPIEQFVSYGFAERMVLTHLLALGGWLLISRTWKDNLAEPLRAIGFALAGLALFRFVYFDIFLLSPVGVKQALGPAPVANLGTLHYVAAAFWFWQYARTESVRSARPTVSRPLEIASLFAAIAAVMVTVRQAVHGSDIATPPFTETETYLYSAGLLVLAIAWLARGIQTTNALLRIAGLLLLTIVTFKVFLVDAAQLDGVLRILSFLGLGIALIGIGWIYGKVMKTGETEAAAV